MNNREKLLDFFGEDLSQPKARSSNAKIIHDSQHVNDNGKTIRRLVYAWKLEKPILLFDTAEQIEFNGKPKILTLRTNKANFKDMKLLMNKMAELLGPDMNNHTNLTVKESSLSSITLFGVVPIHNKPIYSAMRYWSFDASHNSLKRYPPEGEGYTIMLHRYHKDDSLEIMDFWDLFDDKASVNF